MPLTIMALCLLATRPDAKKRIASECQEPGALECACPMEDASKPLKLVSPNGGETLKAGTLDSALFCIAPGLDSAWATTSVLSISGDSGRTWKSLTSTPRSAQNRIFLVPAKTGEGYLVKVTPYDLLGNPNQDFDLSDAFFTVAESPGGIRPRGPVSKAASESPALPRDLQGRFQPSSQNPTFIFRAW
ncbi:MAG: hypothetical protein ABI036_06360 [Fibrobacteria bacterium]